MTAHRRKYRWIGISCVGLLLGLLGAIIVAYTLSRRQSLPEHVLELIPSSMEQAQVDSKYYPVGHTHVLRFRAHAGDMAEIVNSRPFVKRAWVSFWNGNLYWGDRKDSPVRNPRENPFFGRDVSSVPLYQGERAPPNWFTPNDWIDPNVYVLKERWGRSKKWHTRVIVYNKDIAEAYLIDYLPRH